MIVLYPNDPSTHFLSDICKVISNSENVDVYFRDKDTLTYEEIISIVEKSHLSRLILYLGHGTSTEIYYFGTENVITSEIAQQIFKGKKLILLACYSSEFLRTLNKQFYSAIGFGNILTSRAELEPRDYNEYNHEDFKCISLFREKLVKLFIQSLTEARALNSSFLQFNNSLKLRINKVISECSISEDKTDKLLGKLMFDLKTEIKLFGDPHASLF